MVARPGPSRPSAARVRGRGRATAAALLAKPRLDLRHDPRLRVEELLLHPGPAAEAPDREEPGPHRVAELPDHAPEHRPEAVLAEDRLRLRGVEEADERARRGWVGGVPRHGDRVLDPDRRLRDHLVDGL